MGQAIAGAHEPFDLARAEGPVLDPRIYVPALLTHLSNALTNNASLFYRQNFGIGLTDWRIMYRLSAEPWITAHRICAMSALDKAVVSRSIAWMEQRRLIDVRDDATDARRRLIALSPAGRDLHDRITVVALARERNLLAGLSADETATTIRLLTKLIDNLEAFSQPVEIPPTRIPVEAVASAPMRRGAARPRP